MHTPYYVTRGLYIYALMSGVLLNGGNSCQNTYMAPAEGWELAPNDDDSMHMARTYTLSTQVVVFADGYSVTTEGYPPGGAAYSSSCLEQTSGSTGGMVYKPCICGGQILVRAPAGCAS